MHRLTLTILLLTLLCACRREETPDPVPTQPALEVSAPVQAPLSEPQKPLLPFESCAPGVWTVEGVVWRCGESVSVVWGYAVESSSVSARELLGGFKNSMERVREEDILWKQSTLGSQRGAAPMLTYAFTERLEEMPPRDVRVTGVYAVASAGASRLRTLHCSGLPQEVERICGPTLGELALGGAPAHLMPGDKNPYAGTSLVPMLAGRQVIVPGGCQHEDHVIDCGDSQLMWKTIEETDAPHLEALAKDEFEATLRRSYGDEVRRRKRACELLGREVSCEHFEVRSEQGQILFAAARAQGQRALIFCFWQGTLRDVPQVCQGVLEPR